MDNNHESYMKQAIEEAEKSVREGNAPFSVIVVDGEGNVVAQDHDRVKELMDPTAHGEVNVIRRLCKERNTLDLSDLTFYTTSEPCPTCLSSCIKAKVKALYFGAETEPSASLPIKAVDLIVKANNPIQVQGGILAEECLKQREKYR